jgi:hypothetical protein
MKRNRRSALKCSEQRTRKRMSGNRSGALAEKRLAAKDGPLLGRNGLRQQNHLPDCVLSGEAGGPSARQLQFGDRHSQPKFEFGAETQQRRDRPVNSRIRAAARRENEYGESAKDREDSELVPQVPGNHRLAAPHERLFQRRPVKLDEPAGSKVGQVERG